MNLFIFITMSVQVSLPAPRLIPRGPEIYSRKLTSVALRGLKLMTIEEQTQSLTTELPFRVIVPSICPISLGMNPLFQTI